MTIYQPSKICTNCDTAKSLEEFSKCSAHKDGRHYSCKLCDNARAKLRYSKFTPEQKEQRRLYDNAQYSKNSPEQIIKRRLRTRLYHAIIGHTKTTSAVKDLGCSIEFFKSYIESKFTEGMSWDNYGLYGWHIDHIHPLGKVNFSIEEEVKKAVHYTNLQPLWAVDNLRKGDKVN